MAEKRAGRGDVDTEESTRSPLVRIHGAGVAGRAGRIERWMVETVPRSTSYIIVEMMTSGGRNVLRSAGYKRRMPTRRSLVLQITASLEFS